MNEEAQPTGSMEVLLSLKPPSQEPRHWLIWIQMGSRCASLSVAGEKHQSHRAPETNKVWWGRSFCESLQALLQISIFVSR